MNELAVIPPQTLATFCEKSQAATAAFSLATTEPGNFVAALQVADSIQNLRDLLDDPAVKQRIVALQDSPLGFRTDRDPKVKNWKTKEYNQQYEWPVVRDAVIEAVLRGLQLVGNQFNVMSGRFYCTKEGFEFLIQQVPGLSSFKPIVGIPNNKTGGAIVECKATWVLNGTPDSLDASIPVKTDDYSGADQIIGKATRKFLYRCHKVITGKNTPEGDAADSDRVHGPDRPEIRTVSGETVPFVPVPTVVLPPIPEPTQDSAPPDDLETLRSQVADEFKRHEVAWKDVQAASVAGQWFARDGAIPFKDLNKDELEYMLKRAERIARAIKNPAPIA